MKASDAGKFKASWVIQRYANDAEFKAGHCFSTSVIDLNRLLNEGIGTMWDLIIGAGGTAFDNANANLGVGNGPTPTALTGTSVTLTNGSAAVSGVGTSFVAEVSVGDMIRLDADDVFAEVLSVTDNTNIVLKANYTGSGGTGAGSIIPEPVATETGLAGTSTAYKGMAATYPSRAGQVVTWRSVFAETEGNFRWLEFTVANGNSDVAQNLNRRISDQGVKADGQIWTLDLNITLS